MSQALYRRYRPETFAEVIGQEHVTEPLMHALRSDRVTHAYLFSGPRGCGKTTSARILARCLNCEQGPTAEPCGTCASCVELGRGGPGSLDVVEIDAASHNGVDDARDLRERAAFAPARDRFKVFILDEAHMVTPQGFNALLKIVEEPPPHVKFIFATTEPDKVIGTIRSRTHHYPFRLVAPDTLTPYLEEICASEGVQVGSGVLPLVVRAGGGSVRDSLSVLDQLVAGADADGLDYERAVALLGYTHAALLDDVVGAISARDGASAFRVIDRVISSGHEPRRFIEDLLERLRDLIVIAASGESARAALRDLPTDQLERMRAQAAALGPAELSRSADLANTALTEMTGATSPRLHLELLVARLLLPSPDSSGVVARLERVERSVAEGGVVPRGVGAPTSVATISAPTAPERPAAPVPVPAERSAPPASVAAAPAPAAPDQPAASPVRAPSSAPPERRASEPPAPDLEKPAPDATAEPGEAPAAGKARPARAGSAGVPEPAAPAPGRGTPSGAPRSPAPAGVPSKPSAAPSAREEAASPRPGAAPAPSAEAEMVRRRWPEVLQTLRGLRMASWVLVSENAQVASIENGTVKLAFTTPQLATTFRSGPHAEHVRRALHETLGLDARVEPVLASDTPAPAAPTRTSRPSAAQAAASWDAPATTAARSTPEPADRGPGARSELPAAPAQERPASRPTAAPQSDRAADGIPDGPEPDEEPEPAEPEGSSAPTRPRETPAAPVPSAPRPAPARPAPVARPGAARAAGRPARPAPASTPAPAADEFDASPDDPELAGSGLVGAPLVAQMLGGTVIDEIPDEPK
ncbi:DNA polymerase III subunit gamma and tau [Actinotalea sp. M2MS4P-6]|uniref:DNA polymerase III subunit gamma and tau n=1 Tax=Actinotalea sp. M2MS4P-6 TaxID=2983762 RepID=UPI0021E4BEC2|nr:DNA polymerase III subunit gamma and tau [Actinotalea sp. M2MS4P-6]MCV2393161.1 DNA polymerase III subunit gamma and tau [Actinotalea sp. M2MS4P-6]